MTHYVCGQCHGVSDVAKACDTETCPAKGHDLVACDCSDNKHQTVAAQQIE